ncbi:MAG: UDP-2,3-diacylglucosamine diphosphatase LpxI [Verrucomicrobiota bacterium]|nr:UDP-2,3-diacylglucosamine diphosphatase LpxI [Verrucomicrobiota bacterium]
MNTKNKKRIGLIAGRGIYPILFAESAKKAGIEHLAVIAMHDETSDELLELADSVDWIYVGQIGKAIKYLKKHGVNEAVMAGQIKPSRLFGGIRPDLKALKLLWSLEERNAETIFSGIADEFEKAGIEILPSTTFLDEYLAEEGVIGKKKPSKKQQQDIRYGFKIAKEVSALDIGQTVVVNKGTVLAVEGFEGTDKTIERGGSLGDGKSVVVKVAKPNHDMRFDVPCIGTRTAKKIINSDISVLAVEAGKTLFLEKEKVINMLNDHKIVVFGVEK